MRGWVKIFSYTRPRLNVVHYSPWYVRQQGQETVWQVLQGQVQGDGVVVSWLALTIETRRQR